MLNPKFPNLELLEYKTRQLLANDNEFMEALKQKKCRPCFEVKVFPQMWGSTCTGFDVCEDGSPAIGGCAMTKEYTTIFRELKTDTYVVFFGDRACYKVTDANDSFHNDYMNESMASLSEAKRRY